MFCGWGLRRNVKSLAFGPDFVAAVPYNAIPSKSQLNLQYKIKQPPSLLPSAISRFEACRGQESAVERSRATCTTNCTENICRPVWLLNRGFVLHSQGGCLRPRLLATGRGCREADPLLSAIATALVALSNQMDAQRPSIMCSWWSLNILGRSWGHWHA